MPITEIPPSQVACERCAVTATAYDTWPDYITHEPSRNGSYCESCPLITCDECGETAEEYDNHPHYISQRLDGTYCDGCVNFCDECQASFVGDYCPNEDNHSSDDGCSCGCCSTGSDYVHDYSYRPTPVFHGNGPAYLGAEIEIATPYRRLDDAAEVASETLGSLGYLKEDGSIGTGFEMVTHPMSYDWAIDNFPWHLLGDLARMGCEATTDTGIHVHVSRAGFDNPCHVYRWLKFIYRNARKVQTIARRKSDQWAAFCPYTRRNHKDHAKGDRSADRYNAVNVQNDATFEVRVFASSLKPAEVKAALAFVAASVEYTRTLSANDILRHDGWTWGQFMSWLPAKYQPLREEESRLCAS